MLGGEDGEDEFVAPGALEELGLAEVGLLAQAEAAAEGRGGMVAASVRAKTRWARRVSKARSIRARDASVA